MCPALLKRADQVPGMAKDIEAEGDVMNRSFFDEFNDWMPDRRSDGDNGEE